MLRRIQQPQPGTPGAPLLFLISALGSFTCVTQHIGPTAWRPTWMTKQWLSVLLKDTRSWLGIRNHTLLIRNTRVWNSVLLTARPRHFHKTMCTSLLREFLLWREPVWINAASRYTPGITANPIILTDHMHSRKMKYNLPSSRFLVGLHVHWASDW